MEYLRTVTIKTTEEQIQKYVTLSNLEEISTLMFSIEEIEEFLEDHSLCLKQYYPELQT